MRRIGIGAYDGFLRLTKYGRTFNKCLREFRDVQGYGVEDWEEWRSEKRSQVLEVAARAPFYQRSVFCARSRTYPEVTKELYRALSPSFVVPGHGKSPKTLLTSGTTGSRLAVQSHREHVAAVAASWWAFRARFGIEFGDRGVVFGGRVIFPGNRNVKEPWVLAPFTNQILVSTYHLGPATLPKIVAMLNKERPRWIHAYPSSILQVARFMRDAHIALDDPPLLVSTGSESITSAERELLRETFRCQISELYGQVEGVCSAWRCSDGNLHDQGLIGDLHVSKDTSCERGVIVGTGYWNFVAPMIGYITGDHIEGATSSCSCGAPFAIGKEISGRADDFVVASDGRQVGRLAKLFTYVSTARASQLVQKGFAEFELHILSSEEAVVDKGFRELLEQMLGERINFKIVEVAQLERSSNGKVRSVLRKL